MNAEDDLVHRHVRDGVALLTLNRPHRHNAWTVDMEAQYFRELRRAEADPAVRIIVLTGSGQSFCPGLDAEVLAASAGGRQTQPHLRTPMTTPTAIRKPIIAAINGACAGIGLVVALNCDLRFAAASAKLTTSFVQRGIMAEHGIAWTLPRIVGAAKALDLLLSGRIVQGDDALQLGLVDRVFPASSLLEETLTYAHELARRSSPLAMGVIKDQVYRALDSTQEESRQLALSYWVNGMSAHPDHREGVLSYLERRDPEFEPWDPATTRDPGPLPSW